MILLIDNYDSFTYNLYQYLCELGAEVSVVRNDKITLGQIRNMNPEKIVVSPGPCTPDKAGISNEVVREFGPIIPVLGVCLGHQCVGQTFGGIVGKAGEIMHGKTSLIHHDGEGAVRKSYLGRLAPYLERLCLRSLTPCVSSTPRRTW